MERNLDKLGISVCSVSGTNFKPYAQLLSGLGIPFSILTDWDPRKNKEALGANRARNLIRAIEEARSGQVSAELEERINDNDFNRLCELAEEYGIFINDHTLEVDLFLDGYEGYIAETLHEHGFGAQRTERIIGWAADPKTLEISRYLRLIEEIGKGRFAQRLAARLEAVDPPRYIDSGIDFVAERV